MGRKTVTWVAVADGSGARLFANDGPGLGLHPAMAREFSADQPPVRDIVSDRAGRHPDRETGIGGGRHAMDPRTDPRRHVEEEFIRGVAGVLGAEALKKSYQRLVLVAPPRTLGDLRRMLPRHAAGLVTAEVNKDLVHLDAGQVAGRLADILP